MSQITTAVKKISSQLEAVDNLLEKKISFLDMVQKNMSSYLEINETTTSMLQATGAEIEGRGRADPKTVLGIKRGLFARARKGASLSDYYGKKSNIIHMIVDELKKIEAINNNELNYEQTISHESEQEDEEVKKTESGHQLSKKDKKLLK
ncbi:MAG: hypothetical protein ACQESC_01605 [Nanobdellota archaeon]